MSAPAARGSATVSLFAIALFVAFVASAGVAITQDPRREDPGPVRQPVVFNHQVHTGEEGEAMDCVQCHTGVRNSPHSGLPGKAVCALCHMEMQGESAAEAELVRILNAGEPLEWVPLFQQPPHVFYSHQRHVTVAGLECRECHDDVGASTTPPDRPAPLAMDDCIGCHERVGATTDCTACHR